MHTAIFFVKSIQVVCMLINWSIIQNDSFIIIFPIKFLNDILSDEYVPIENNAQNLKASALLNTNDRMC